MVFWIVVLFTLALFHWAFEGAVAPSFRLALRYRLFAIRDELRNFAEREGKDLSEPAFQFLEESINSVIEHMREINFGFILSFNRRLELNKSFRRRCEFRTGTVEAFADPEFRQIRRRYDHVYREIVAVNSGGWFIYLLPVLACAVCWDWLRRLTKMLALVPESEFPALSRGIQEVYAEPA